MTDKYNLEGTKLTEEDRKGISTFCDAMRESLGDNLLSITLYGSAARADFRPKQSDVNLLVVVNDIDVHVLKRVSDSVRSGRRYGIAPFFITKDDLFSSTDTFPVKFLSIKETCKVLWGMDILRDLNIGNENVRLRCEQEIKNLLWRMRRFYLFREGAGLGGMMAGSIGGFIENLRFVVLLSTGKLPPREDVIGIASKEFGFKAETLYDILALRDRKKSFPEDAEEKLFDKYMSLVGQVAQVLDRLES